MKDKIIEMLRAHCADKDMTITEDMLLLNDLGLNSYNLIVLLSEIEEEIDLEISDDQLVNIKTVKDIFNVLESNQHALL